MIGVMKSKFDKDVGYGPFRGFSGQKIWEILESHIEDPFARNAFYESLLKGFVDVRSSVVKGEDEGSEQVGFLDGIPPEYIEFHEALNFLRIHNPTRMKAIEQLETNYHRAVQLLKVQKRSALTSLQTRQSLEMDMLTNQRDFSKPELEALVGQHIAEVDGLVSHWEEEIRTLQTVQLKEYRELVMEVYCSEKMGKLEVRRENVVVGKSMRGKWERPILPPGTEWIKMVPIAALGPGTGPGARCVRLIHLRSEDYVSSVINPIIAPNEEFDPEELCFVEESNTVVCGVVLGAFADLGLKSNQDIQLLKILDKCPVDCRWPSFVDQIATVRMSGESGRERGRVVVTRHSNLGLGVKFILHKIFENDDIVRIEDVVELLEIADSLRIERLYVADVFAADLRSPTVIDKSTRPDRAREFLHVLKIAISRLDNQFSNPAKLREIVVIES